MVVMRVDSSGLMMWPSVGAGPPDKVQHSYSNRCTEYNLCMSEQNIHSFKHINFKMLIDTHSVSGRNSLTRFQLWHFPLFGYLRWSLTSYSGDPIYSRIVTSHRVWYDFGLSRNNLELYSLSPLLNLCNNLESRFFQM